MSNFAQRIKQARLAAGLSQEALAEAISQLFDKKKISRTAITQWESNKTAGIEAANLLKATKVLNVMPDWLQFGSGNMRPIDHSEMMLNVRTIPLLSEVQAANPKERYKTILSEVGLDESLAKVAGPYSFALMIQDNSMAPLFISSDLIILDPSIQPHPGEFVVAKLKNVHTVVFRKYQPTSHLCSSQFELISLNTDWGKIKMTEKNSEILGVLIEHRCKRRLDPGIIL